MKEADKINKNPFLDIEDLHAPKECSKCKGKLKYEGIGEFVCLDCGNIERDDYGKVRFYIENHHDNRLAVVAAATGVSRQSVQRMLDEGKIETTSRKYVDAD